MIEALFSDCKAFANEEVKVWISTEPERFSSEFSDALSLFLGDLEILPLFFELVVAKDHAEFSPGQHFFHIKQLPSRHFAVDLRRISEAQPTLEFRGVTFHVYESRLRYKGLKIGDCRHLEAAAKRALVQTGGLDWFGGISDFSDQFLRRPERRKKPAT